MAAGPARRIGVAQVVSGLLAQSPGRTSSLCCQSSKVSTARHRLGKPNSLANSRAAVGGSIESYHSPVARFVGNARVALSVSR